MDSWIADNLQSLKDMGLYRSTRCIEGEQSSRVTIHGNEMLLLCSNNYLGLADHPVLKDASCAAVMRYGTSSGASRLVSGTMTLHEQLESAVARFKGCEAALLFNSGYAANTGIIPALVGKGDTVYSDRLNHASIIDGIMLSGARLIRYPHNDFVKLRQHLEKADHSGRRLIVTDGIFSMDGDCAPLVELAELKRTFNTLLMVDDAHGSGILGSNGQGSAHLLGVAEAVDIHMGTFGKALGSFGAYAATSHEIRELLLNKARSLIFSTSLPPSVLAASIAALEIVQSGEGKQLRFRLEENACFFRKQLVAAGFTIPDGFTQIIPIIVGQPETTMQFSEELLHAGIFAQGIRPPTVPASACRIRFTMMASHDLDELAWACNVISSVAGKLGII